MSRHRELPAKLLRRSAIGPLAPKARQDGTVRSAFLQQAQEFYRELEADNSREFWLANKPRYERDVRDPLRAVASLLAEEFGEPRLFRPNRDVRFSSDKAPYKTHQGAFVKVAPACGFYLEINSTEARAAGGFYDADPEALARFRKAVADDETGPGLERLLETMEADGWLSSGDTLKTAPRGYPRDHPRIGLLRYRTLSVECEIVADGIEEFTAEVREAWRGVTPLVDWCAARLRD